MKSKRRRDRSSDSIMECFSLVWPVNSGHFEYKSSVKLTSNGIQFFLDFGSEPPLAISNKHKAKNYIWYTKCDDYD